MKRFLIVVGLVSLLAVLTGPATAKSFNEAAEDGADYLVAEQLADGGWSWENGGTSASNIAGATGIGLIRYYNIAGGSTYLDAAKDAGDFIRNHTYPSPSTENRFATFDPYYCWQLSLSAGDSTWSDHAATEFFDELTASTYGPSNYDTAGWISVVETGRTGTWVNLRPWEFSTIPVTAKAIGNAGQEAAFKQAILDGLDTLDDTDPDNVYSDLIGVAGGLRGLALDGVTNFTTAVNSPNHSGVNGINSLSGLADYLAGVQNADGSWYWHSDLTSPGDGDKDTQTTAYAVLALEAAGRTLSTNAYDDEVTAGRAWLVTMQEDDTGDPGFGGFYSYPGDSPPINNEVTGEALAALPIIPEPGALSLIGLGLVGLRRRRRR